jgi:putative FmdB family regulatory protein
MPVYEYLCDPCGAFARQRPLAEWAAPQPCPRCGAAAPRAVLTAPHVATTSTALRRAHARNERAAEAPRLGHAARGGQRRSAHARRAARRPWMLSH